MNKEGLGCGFSSALLTALRFFAFPGF